MSWIRRLNFVTGATLPELIFSFIAILFKAGFSAEIYKLILKFTCTQENRIRLKHSQFLISHLLQSCINETLCGSGMRTDL